MQMLQDKKVEFLAAPFEDDAQPAHLSRTQVVDAVLSEDGDMFVMLKCHVLLSKLDEQSETDEELGWGDIVDGIKYTILKELDGKDLYQKMVEVFPVQFFENRLL